MKGPLFGIFRQLARHFQAVLFRLLPRFVSSRRATRLGREGERLAAEFLRQAGYEILAQQSRPAGVEVDIVAKRGNSLVLVEVKTRRAGGPLEALAAIDSRKQKRLRRAARWFARRSGSDLACVQVDVIVISLGQEGQPAVHHFPKVMFFDLPLSAGK